VDVPGIFVLLEETETENKEFRTELAKYSSLIHRFPILQKYKCYYCWFFILLFIPMVWILKCVQCVRRNLKNMDRSNAFNFLTYKFLRFTLYL